jgi:transposase
MDTPDARTLSNDALEQLRWQAVRLSRRGETNTAIAEILGVNRRTVGLWLQRYAAVGPRALQAKRRGRKVGEQRTLTPGQETAIQRLLIDKTPDQLTLTFALWSRQAVRELLRVRWGVRMPIRTVGEYLRRWGFTPQKPVKRAYEQSPAAVQRWLTETSPAIAARAKQEAAEIHWGDETGVRSDDVRGRGYAPRGQTPVRRIPARRHSVSMISTLTNQGKVRFMLYRQALNAQRLIRFLTRLTREADRKVFLILDNLKVHHATLVRDWLAAHVEAIEVFYLPSYSPELNPDEYLNGDLKAGVHGGIPPRSEKALVQHVLGHMRMLQRLPGRTSRYFAHPCIRYAAA